MRKNCILLCSIVLLLALITILVATQVYANNEQRILNGEKITSASEAYVEINPKTRSLDQDSEIYDAANSYVEKIGENIQSFNVDNSKKLY